MAFLTRKSIASVVTFGWLLICLSACATGKDSRGWQRVAGSADDIAIGGDGSAWVVEKQSSEHNCSCVSRFNGTSWVRYAFPRYASRIASDALGRPWVATTVGEIYRFDGSAFQLFPGPTAFPNAAARDIAVGKKDSVWLVGREKSGNAYKIHRYEDGSWTTVPGGAISVTANSNGDVWILDGANGAFQFNGTSFVHRFTGPSRTHDIGVGEDGIVWIATNEGSFLWNGFYLAGKGNPSARISVAPNNAAWIVSSWEIYRWVGPLRTDTGQPQGKVVEVLAEEG